jgi:hypothetical protein
VPFQPYEPTPPLVFPIAGRDYTVASINERDFPEGLRWQQIFAGAEPEPAAMDQPKMILGDVFDEMIADGCSATSIARASFATLTDYRLGRGAAEKAWESGINPEALAAAMAATPSTPTPTPSTSTAAAAKTPRRASGNGTRTSRPTSKAKAKSSRSRA